MSALIELACHDPSCAPPPVGTGGSVPTLSTRVPTAVNVDKPLHGMGTTLSEIPLAVAHDHARAIVSRVPGFQHLRKLNGFRSNASEESQEELVKAVVDQVADNVVEVFDRSPNPEVTRQWYDAANKLSADLAAEFGMHKDTAAAVAAALSPQADWDMNVQQARIVMEGYQRLQNGPVTTSDIKLINRVISEQHAKKVAAWERRVKKQEDLGNYTKADEIRSRPPQPAQHLRAADVRTGADLSSEHMAYLIRQQVGSSTFHRMQLTGEDGGYTISTEPVRTKSGKLADMRWQSYGPLTDAVEIMRDPRAATISAALGGQHKVRSFYNNIAYPNDAQADVTMDTHAFGIAFRIPVTSNHPAIKSGAGNLYSTPSNAAAGTRGTHVLLAEGYRQAARRINRRRSTQRKYQPREIQSVTWEQWRKEFPGETRSKGKEGGTMGKSEKILRQLDDGIITEKEASKQLANLRAV